MAAFPKILAAGDSAFVVEFGDTIDRPTNARVMALHRAIGQAQLKGVIETIPTFRSLMVQYDPIHTSRAELEAPVLALAERDTTTAAAGRRWRIPVCYDGELAPDLDDVATRTKLSREQVIAAHLGATFFAYVLGFMPGFAYLGGLPKELELPRRTEPRVRVPKNSVAIAQALTAIYPWESPGGWHLIGRTPIELFDLRRAHPILWSAGDEAVFARINRAQFDAIAAQVAAGSFDSAALEVKP
ncbi:MAG: 5-oxoprolinase subunit PxpB [Rhodospirillales bacterium]